MTIRELIYQAKDVSYDRIVLIRESDGSYTAADTLRPVSAVEVEPGRYRAATEHSDPKAVVLGLVIRRQHPS